MEFFSVKIEKGDENVILGQTHFIKTVEDIYEALKNSSASSRFGIAFCEASGKRLIRKDGNDDELMSRATKNAQSIGAGHTFIIHLRNAFPINVIPHLKYVPEIVTIYAATSNDLTVLVAQEDGKRGVIGVLDGDGPLGVEGEEDMKERKEFLRKIGYKR